MKKEIDDAAGVWIGIAASIKPFIALFCFLLSFVVRGVLCGQWFLPGVALLLGAVAGFLSWIFV